MAIDALRDGFVSLCFDASANSIATSKCRVVIEGQFTSGTTVITADTLIKVASSRDIEAKFGIGSVLSESLKVAMSCCGNDSIEIFALARPAGAGSVAAQYTLTVAGLATTAGRVDIYWGNSIYNISVAVAIGATPTVVAAAIVAAAPAGFPYTMAAVAGVITLTARNAGVVGNFLVPSVNWHGRSNYLPAGLTFVTANPVVGVGAPAALNYTTALGECCVCCYALLHSGASEAALIAYLDSSWACTSPQCFGHGYVYNAGSLGAILATDSNSATVSRLAHGVGDPNFPWLKTAAYAALSCCTTDVNPELSIQGPTYGVLECVRHPESCTQSFTFAEQTQLRDAGFVVTVPASNGQGDLTSPMITNDVTNSRFDSQGAANLTFQATSSRRLATQTATAIANQLQAFNGLGYYSSGTALRSGTKGTNKRMILGAMRAWAKTQVGILFSQFDNLDTDLTFTDDFETAAKCQGIPGKLAMNLIYRPPVRIKAITVNAVPKILTNC